MEYFITGFPGTGKSTIAEILRQKGYSVYDVDREKSLTQWVNKNTGDVVKGEYSGTPEFYDNHDFHWNRDALIKLIERAPTRPVFILGITSNQTEDLDLFKKTFLLQADQDTLKQRMISRKSTDPTKKDEDVDYGFSWHQSFDQEMIKHGAIPIDASLPVEEVVLKIEASL